MRIFLTGGTGLVGPRLIRALAGRGDRVVLLTRRPDAARQFGVECDIVAGDPTQAGPWQDEIANCDAVVNLAGASIMGGRWTAKYKALLVESRVKSTGHCATALAKNPRRADGSPRVLVNASAIGFYGPHGDEELDESSPPGDDFLAGLCQQWEQAAAPAMQAGVRTVLSRLGVVLDPKGGALKMMLLPFRLGLGGPVASGRQYLSWVHHADVVGLLTFALDQPQARGPMNVVAPDPRTSKEFGKALGKAMGRPSFMWTPGFMLKLVMGEGAQVIVTGQRVAPRRAHEWGYRFCFPKLEEALGNIIQEPRTERAQRAE